MLKFFITLLFISSAALGEVLDLEGFIVRDKNENDDGTIFGIRQALLEYKKSSFPGSDTPTPIKQYGQRFCGNNYSPSFKVDREDTDTAVIRLVCGDRVGIQTYLMEPGAATWTKCREGRVLNDDRVKRSLSSEYIITDCPQEGWFRMGERSKESGFMMIFLGNKGKATCETKARQTAKMLNMAYAEDKVKEWTRLNDDGRNREQTRFLNQIATCDQGRDKAAIATLIDPYKEERFRIDESKPMTERVKLAAEVKKDVLARPGGSQVIKNCELLALGTNKIIDYSISDEYFCQPAELSCQYNRSKRFAETTAAVNALTDRFNGDASVCCSILPDKFNLLVNGGCIPIRSKGILAH